MFELFAFPTRTRGMTWTSGFYKAWWGTTSPSWEVSQVSPSKSIKVTGASWKWKWKWTMMENMWHKKDENLVYRASLETRTKTALQHENQLFTVSTTGLQVSPCFPVWPRHWANRCHFPHDQDATIPTDVQISSDTVLNVLTD